MQRSVIVAGVSALLLLGTAGPALAVPAAPSAPSVYYANCTEAFAAGAADIPQGTPGYRPALDRDRDGVACDDGDPANTAGAGTVADESISGETVPEEIATAPAQVSVVPVGAAATGDGSMAEMEDLVETDTPVSVSSSVLWWSGGGLGVALAAIVAGRRPSPRR